MCLHYVRKRRRLMWFAYNFFGHSWSRKCLSGQGSPGFVIELQLQYAPCSSTKLISFCSSHPLKFMPSVHIFSLNFVFWTLYPDWSFTVLFWVYSHYIDFIFHLWLWNLYLSNISIINLVWSGHSPKIHLRPRANCMLHLFSFLRSSWLLKDTV